MTTATMNPPSTVFATINRPVEITEERIRDLLCGAFEGGFSQTWVKEIDAKFPEGITIEDFRSPHSRKPNIPKGKYALDEYFPWYLLVPFVEGCSVVIVPHEDDEEDIDPAELNRETILKGLEVMATEEPRHFANFVDENDDAITSDVFLQCCVLGKVVFG